MARLESSDAAERLLSLLRPEREADRACREAITAGAIVHAWDGEVEAVRLLEIYGRRLARLREKHARILGADAFEDELEEAATVGRRVAGALVHSPEFNFVLLLDVSKGLVACLGVDAGLGNPEFEWMASPCE